MSKQQTTWLNDYLAAQKEMGPLIKDLENAQFQNHKTGKKSYYASLKSVYETVLPVINKHNFVLYHKSGTDEIGPYVKTILAHTSGDGVDTIHYLVIDKNNMQGMGSANTYARRYGTMELCSVAPEDDDGNASSQKENLPIPTKKAKKISDPWTLNIPGKTSQTAAEYEGPNAWAIAYQGTVAKIEKFATTIGEKKNKISQLFDANKDNFVKLQEKNEALYTTLMEQKEKHDG